MLLLITKKTSDSNNFWSFDNRIKMIFSTHEVKMQKVSVIMQRKCCEFSFIKRKVVNFFHWKCYGQIFPQANCENKAIRKKVWKKVGLKNCWRKVGVKFSTVLVTRECKRDCHMFVCFFVIFIFIFILGLGFGFKRF